MSRKLMNIAWELPEKDGCLETWDHVSIAVLMDIRDELQRLNALLACPNFTRIPATLQTIARKIPTRRRRVKR